MEFQTTIEKLPELIRKLNLPPQTSFLALRTDQFTVVWRSENTHRKP